MLGPLRATVGIVVLVIAIDMRTAAAFAPRLLSRARLSSPITSFTLATTQRWMSTEGEAATQERSEEEQAAIKAAREARK